MIAFLDTHPVIFLWEGRIEAFGSHARRALEHSTLLVSPIVRLELQLLREIGKIKAQPDQILGALISDLGVTMTSDPVDALVPHAMPLTWTRDPFDRLIVATALLHRGPLVTRDQRIHDHFQGSIW